MKIECVLCGKEVEKSFSFFCKKCLKKDSDLLKTEDILKDFKYKDELRILCKKLKTGTYEEVSKILGGRG